MNRRDLLLSMSTAAVTPRLTPTNTAEDKQELQLEQFQPRSMLHTRETKVPRSAFPVIDMHTHITHAGGLEGPGNIRFAASAEDCLAVMDRKNIRTMVNLTSGYGPNLQQAIDKLQAAHSGRFVVFTEPAWSKAADPNYSKTQADLIEDAHNRGAKGLKVLKTLGLYLRENVTTGKLVRIDDWRFDAMWDAAGSFNMPVAIHSSDPEAFFLPVDRFNERWEELHAHPDWSFYGRDFPTNRELQEARRNVMLRHPRTQFVCLHVATRKTCNMSPSVSTVIRIFTSRLQPESVSLVASPEPPTSSSRNTRTGSCSELMPFPEGKTRRSKYSTISSMRSTTGFWRPKMNTSITRRHQRHRKGGGGSMDLVCRNRSFTRSIRRMRRVY
jgi:hypothetical protein